MRSWAARPGAGGGGGEDTSEERIDDAMHVKGRKRKKKSAAFWRNIKTPSIMMSAGIVSLPLRRMLGQMFAAEREARISDVLQEERSKTLLGDFVKPGGHFDKADEALEALLEDQSPLLKDFCLEAGAEAESVKRSRGMVLRLKASLDWRLLRRTRRKTSMFEMVRTLDENSQECTDAFCSNFMAESLKDCCLEPYFEKRTRDEFKRLELGAKTAFAESAPFARAVRWTASTAPLFMISARETDHASLSNKIKGTKHWQQGLLAPAQFQLLEKWRQQLPLRVAKQEQLFAQDGQPHKRLNQHSGQGNKVSQIVELVDVALQKTKRTKAAGQRAGGALFDLAFSPNSTSQARQPWALE